MRRIKVILKICASFYCVFTYQFCLVVSRGQRNSEVSSLHQSPLPILQYICISSAKPGELKVSYHFSRRRLLNERNANATIQILFSFKIFQTENTPNLFTKIPKALFLLNSSKLSANQIIGAHQSYYFC